MSLQISNDRNQDNNLLILAPFVTTILHPVLRGVKPRRHDIRIFTKVRLRIKIKRQGIALGLRQCIPGLGSKRRDCRRNI